MAKKELYGEMPHSLEAEQALLGCLIADGKIQVEVVAYLSEDDFYTESHKYIYKAIDSIVSKNQTVDLVTLTDALEKSGDMEHAGGIQYITDLTFIVPSSANYKRYLDIVLRDSTLRKIIRGSTEIIQECQQSQDKDKSLSFAEKTIYDISNDEDTSELVKVSSLVPDVMNKFDELSKDKSKFRGIKTKFKGLDRITDGLHKSDLIILAARPATGKTSFAMNIIGNVALQGYSCAVFSLEMSNEQLVQRMLCSVAGVSMENASRGKMNKTEWLKIAKAREKLSNAKIFIDDSAMITPREIISKCRRLKSKSGLDLVMIDYIQLMAPDKARKDDNRQNEISEISRNLKILAKEINVPVIALSQLSRAVETRKGRPQLSDLRESGAIEQDADIVMFIHRPDKQADEKQLAEGKVQKNVAEILIEKHRNGATGMVKLYFQGECTRFLNINEETGEIEGNEDNTEINREPSEIKVEEIKSGEEDPFDSSSTESVSQPPREDKYPEPPAEDDGYPTPPPAEDDGYPTPPPEDEDKPVSIDDELFNS